jgi:hypothetical protein
VEESQVESHEDQDDANIHHQSFPESLPEEREVHDDDGGNHCHQENCARNSSIQCSSTSRS